MFRIGEINKTIEMEEGEMKLKIKTYSKSSS